jgi:hypothetical protein
MSVDVGGSVVVCVTTLIEPTEIETRGVVVVSFVGATHAAVSEQSLCVQAVRKPPANSPRLQARAPLSSWELSLGASRAERRT